MATKTKNIQFYEGVGRRKTSVATVRMFIPGKDKTVMIEDMKVKAGEIYVNKKKIEEVFPLIRQKFSI